MTNPTIVSRLPIPLQPAAYDQALPWSKALAHLYPAVVQASDGRVERALQILDDSRKPIFATSLPNHDNITYHVRSCTTPHKVYTVDPTAHTCTCADDRQAKQLQLQSRVCKHRLAVGIYMHGPDWISQVKRKANKILRDLFDAEDETYETMCRIIDLCQRPGTAPASDDTADLDPDIRAQLDHARNAHATACAALTQAQINYPFLSSTDD